MFYAYEYSYRFFSCEENINLSPLIKPITSGENISSIDWRCSIEKIFNYNKLEKYLTNIAAECIIAIFITELVRQQLTKLNLDKKLRQHAQASNE